MLPFTVAFKALCVEADKLCSERILKMSLLKIGATLPLGRFRHSMSITPGEKKETAKSSKEFEYLRTRYYFGLTLVYLELSRTLV